MKRLPFFFNHKSKLSNAKTYFSSNCHHFIINIERLQFKQIMLIFLFFNDTSITYYRQNKNKFFLFVYIQTYLFNTCLLNYFVCNIIMHFNIFF